MKGALDGVTVIDLSRVLAGPFAAMILADLGAKVIKVESPGTGDDSRSFPPMINGVSAYFASVNRGKESIALNLKDENDKQILHKLLSKADVVVENFRPGVMERLGFGWDTIHPKYPKLIYACASGFGHTGPYSQRAAYDMVVQAMGGIMSITGTPDGEPVRVGTSIGDLTAGLYTVIGIISALYSRKETGEGCKVDVAMLDGQVAMLENAIARYLAEGEIPQPLGARHPSISPFGAFKTLDSYIIIAAGNDNLFAKLSTAIGLPDLKDDKRYLTNPLRVENVEELKKDLESVLQTKTTVEWMKIINTAGVPCSPINTVKDVIEDSQVNARNMIIETIDEKAGVIKMAGNPIKMSGFDDPKVRVKAPGLDENRAEILKFIE